MQRSRLDRLAIVPRALMILLSALPLSGSAAWAKEPKSDERLERRGDTDGGGQAFAGGPGAKIGERLMRRGDEIMVCGQLVHTTAPVVLWTDPGGYDAYRVERRFVPRDEASWAASQGGALRTPNRYGLRQARLTPAQIERVRGGGWDLPLLQQVVDQFVIHFDAVGTSRRCFEVLHDRRGLSVHFLLDLDGTIYQTLDLKERAFHATIANDRSIGIEIANIGAYPIDASKPLDAWYTPDPDDHTRLIIPDSFGLAGLRDPRVFLHPSRDLGDNRPILRPIRDEPIVGTIQGQRLRQYDLTPQQYDSLIKLTATLCTLFPLLRCDYPHDASGQLIPHKLPTAEFQNYRGILGHYHVQSNKVDPGPAFQWDRVLDGVRRLLAESSEPKH
jgi:N-acetylmuramoyl-L-alanine amidase